MAAVVITVRSKWGAGQGRGGDLPDLGEGSCIDARAGVGKAVEVFDRAQDVLVGDSLVVVTGLHHGADEERRNPVILFLIVLIPGHDQQTVVLLCPLDVGIQVFLEPTIAGLNRLGIFSVVHVVDLVRHDHAHGREFGVIGGKTRHG